MGPLYYIKSLCAALALMATVAFVGCVSDSTPPAERNGATPQYLANGACSVGAPCAKTLLGSTVMVCASNADLSGILHCDESNNVYLATCEVGGGCSATGAYPNGCSTYIYNAIARTYDYTQIVCCENSFLSTMTACPSYVAPVVVDAGVDAPVEAAVDAGTPDAADAAADVASDVAVDAPVEAAVDAGVDAPVEAAVDAGTPDAADAAVVDAATDVAVPFDAGPPPVGQRCLWFKPHAGYTAPLANVKFHFWTITYPFFNDFCSANFDAMTGTYWCTENFVAGTGVTVSIEADGTVFPLDACTDDTRSICYQKGDQCIPQSEQAAEVWATTGWCEAPGATTLSTFDGTRGGPKPCDGNDNLQF